jgi:hypothetical protein
MIFETKIQARKAWWSFLKNVTAVTSGKVEIQMNVRWDPEEKKER